MRLFDAFRRQQTGGPASVRARLEGAMSRRRLRGWQPPLGLAKRNFRTPPPIEIPLIGLRAMKLINSMRSASLMIARARR